ncbi:MAG: DUF1364 family protein [Aquincola sp.]|nr:DUF1364 family protein [Aquincola sp.]
MKRSTFARKPPVREVRDRSDEFKSFVPQRPRAVMATAQAEKPAPAGATLAKVPNRVQQSIRDSARGEQCQVRIVGACTHNPETTIWSHAPLGAAGKGRGIKAIDLAGAYCCTACDAVIDGQAPLPPGATRDSVMVDWLHGHLRSLVILRQKGLV